MISKEPGEDTVRRREFKTKQNTARQVYEPAGLLLGSQQRQESRKTQRLSLPWGWIQDETCLRNCRSAPHREQCSSGCCPGQWKKRWWLVLRDPSSPESAGAGGVCSPLSPHQIREKNQESKTLASLKPTHPSLGDSSQKLETWDLLHSLWGAQRVGEGPFQVVLAGLGAI